MSSKTVIIIGGGIYGISAANRLTKSNPEIKVKLISLSKFTAFICSTVRVPVQNDPEGTFFQIKDVTNDKVELIVDEVTDITKDTVQLKDQGLLKFDALIIATGSKWNDPIISTHELKNDYVEYFEKQYEKFKEAKHIVLIGGGFNNLELIGELNHQYKDELAKGEKEITLIHNGDLVLPDIPKYGKSLRQKTTNYLKTQKGINLVLKSKATILEDGKSVKIISNGKESTVESDLIVTSIGVKPSLPPNSLEDFTNVDGFVKVKDTFQSTNTELSNIFSIGDVNDIEYKGLVHRVTWINVLTNNILAVLNNPTSPAKLKTIVKPTGPQACVVSLGPENAYGQFPIPCIGAVSIPSFICVKAKAADLFKSHAKEIFYS